MKKPLDGWPQTIFQLWLYAPILLFVYIDFISLMSMHKITCIGVLLIWALSAFIGSMVLFSEDFQQFERATPQKILSCFGIAFGVAIIFVIVLSAINENLTPTWSLVKIPMIAGLIVTPTMVVRLEYWLPKSELVPAPHPESSSNA